MPSATRSPSTSSDSAFVSDENLPHVTLSSPASSVSSSVNLTEHGDTNDTSGYAATSFPGYAEKPLDEQLEPIAVVGMGCRLPGDVKSASDFWDLMMSKGTGNTPKVPSSRFNIDAHIHANNDRPGSFGVLGGYFLNDDLADFDPGLFGITPIEAMWMDPQQRKLLEVVYEALESGGIPVEKLAGTRTAVFAASFTADWQQMSFKDASFRHSLAATGVDPGIISNRISHVFNLRGPSIVCNTACSSSVYALHNACNALRNGEAEGAIVGGVNLIITVDQHMNTAKLGVLSPTSTCHTFDASADGYGRADAVGAVYLKRLSDAVRDGDPIRGVIRSSATNSNGKVPGYGITYPNREGQYEVITAAYERGGGLDPRLTGYFECHGTGTAVGDPIEVDAVSRAMNKQRRPGIDPPLWIGAVKTNIGHSEAASGISALIKAILIAERGIIPATRGVVKLNPQIDWEEWQVRAVTDDPVPFPSELPVRRVSVNSFGYGGTNAHMIIEGTASIAPGSESGYRYVDRWATNKPRKPGFFRRAVDRKRPYLLPFSAHDKATLRRNIDAIGPVAADYNLVDLSHTLANRRSILASKAYTVASHGSLDTIFSSVGESFAFADSNVTKTPARELAFVFTGQGAQWARMGAHLMEYSPHFLQTIRDLDLVLEHVADGPEWSIEDLLNEHADTSPVQDAEFSQPLCTAVQIAVVRLLESWGVRPVATVGHSSGEMAAAYAAGLVSAEDAMIAAYYRGIVAKEVNTGGAMLAVGLGAEAVQAWIAECGVEDKVVVACHNSPALVTLSGDADALDLVQGKLEAASVFNRSVKTGGKAYHSHHMVPAAERFKALVREAKRVRSESGRRRRGVADHGLGELLATKAQMVSSVTNSVIPAGTLLDEEYWSRNLVSPVLFNQAVQTLLSDPAFFQVDVLVEVGPHSALAGPIKQIKEALNSSPVGNAKSKAGVSYVPTLIRGEDSGARLLKVAGELFLRGYQQLDMECVTGAYHVQSLKSLKTKSKRLSRNNSAGKVKARVNSPGVTIVDLPPYQWNYTRPFWAENRASREQRLPRFPRHDVLGQRVIGGSLAEPTWNNVLRLRDLPWLKHHSLGGEAVFPAAGYFAMAIEAVTQLHELDNESDDSSKATIDSYVLRDIDIKKALVTPDTEDGIEVLTSLRPSVFGAPFWDFSVSSVDIDENKTTTWKEHMTGSVAINAATTTSRGSQKKPKPRTPPDDLTQRASGKTWNQALRAVGFDYGPTFQDMDNVRFDGKRYVATCTTNVKREVDPTLGESRYPLHPAVVDSTLQLSIAAIYAGRTSAMDCGVVPVQVDQVTIWPPTDEQVAHKSANCYAWVDHRGTRTFENSVQMTSTAGEASEGELIMEIVNVRTTRYEAAIPQKAEDHVPLEPAPYGEMVWQPDIDRLVHTSGHTLSKIKLPSELVSLGLFKYPGLKVLDAASDLAAAKDLLSSYPSAPYTLAVDGDSLSEPFSETEVKSELESGSGPQHRLVNTAVTTIQALTATSSAPDSAPEESESPSESPPSASYDMLVAPAHLVLALQGYVKPGGYIASVSKDDGSIALSRKVTPSSENESAQATESTSPGNDTTFTNLDIALVFRSSPDSTINKTKLAIEAALSSKSESDSHQSTVRVHIRSLQSYVEDAHLDGPVASHVVMLADLEAASVASPLLSSLTETEFSAIQRITDSSSSLLWVTNGGLLEGKRPDHAMASGLARVVRSEQASLDFRTLDVDTDESDDVGATTSAIADSVARVVHCQVAAKASKGTPADEELDEEREMCLFKGETYISRLVRNRELNHVFADSASASDKPALGSFVPGRDRLSGRIRQGKVVFEHVYHQDETRANSAEPAELEPGTVKVAVECSGLTREGVLAITGADYPTTFSHELGGVVVRTGPGVTHLVPGDNVVGFHIDRFSTVQHVPATMLHKLGPGQDMTTVVSLLMASATALYGLDVLARLQARETILVLHQTGFVGVAAAMIARARGATVYIEAETQEEMEFLQDRVGLAPGQILSDLSGSNNGQQNRLSDQIAALTGGRGADVVFSVGGAVKPSTAREAWRCIAPFGRFLDASPGRKNAGAQRQAALDAMPVRRSAQYLPYDVLDLLETRPNTMAALLPSILEHVSIGAIHALGKSVVPTTLCDLAAAISTFSDAFGSPKPVLVLDAPCEDAPIITAPPRDSPRFKFNPDVAYLLVGCLGGLGRSLTRWMMASGARRFLFLSRSGTDAPSAAKLVDDLAAAGATVQVVRGDVANRSDVLRAVEQAPPTSPHPIRGVIHAAMVLRDAVFHSMPYSSWTSSLAPKVQGAMNLHSVLVEELDLPLDFFLMTSSVSGILGTPGQANYAAANSYLDALARHMNNRQQRSGTKTNTAISCILPMVLGVGVVAENDEIEDALRRKGMYGIDEDHLLQSFEAGLASLASQSAESKSQSDHIVIGLDPMLLRRAQAEAASDDDESDASFWVDDARFRHVVHAMRGSDSAAASGGGDVSILAAAASSSSPAEAVAIIQSHFVRKLATMLMMDEESFDVASGSIASYGIDSMIGAELRNWIFREYRIDMPFQQLLAPSLTIGKFAGQVCASVGVGVEVEA